MADFLHDAKHEVIQGIDVVTFGTRLLFDSTQVRRIRCGLEDLLNNGVERLILDFGNVDCFGSEFLEVLISLRRTLSTQRSSPPRSSQQRRLFQIYPDRNASLRAMLSGDADSLVLAAVNEPLQDVFAICAFNTDL